MMMTKNPDYAYDSMLKDPSLLRQQTYINGTWINTGSGETTQVINPADGSVLGTVPKLETKEIKQAVDAANAACPAWLGLLAKERAASLRQWYELIMANQQDLALLMTLE